MQWQTKLIGEFCRTGSGSTPSRQQEERYYSGNIPWVKSGELRESIITETEESITELALKETSTKLIPAGALLVAMYGATVGRIAILGIEATSNQAVCHIIPDESTADPKYMFYALQKQVPKWLEQRVGGAQPNISQQIIRETKIPLPPIAEQRRIADILDRADAVRRKRQAAIALTEELLRSAFLEKFGNPENSKHPVKPLSEICEQITDGSHVTPTYVSNGIPFLRVTDIQSEKIDWNRTKYIPIEEHRELIKRCQPRKGDVLYSKNGTIGIPKLIDWEEEFSIFVSLCLLRPKPGVILGGYLESFLKTPFALRQAMRHTKTGTVSNLHLVEIRQIRLPVPTLDLQEEWLSYRQDIEMHQKKVYQCVIEQDNLFNSLLQRAFSGEL